MMTNSTVCLLSQSDKSNPNYSSFMYKTRQSWTADSTPGPVPVSNFEVDTQLVSSLLVAERRHPQNGKYITLSQRYQRKSELLLLPSAGNI